MNTDSWRGFNVYRDECHLYEKALCWSARRGTSRAAFSRWLGQRARRITWKKFKDALLDDKLVVILTKPINPPSQTHGHIYIVTKGCIAINLIEGKRKSFVTRQMMVGLLKRSHCWIVGKV
jgi:hypothetical protein